MAGSSGEEKGEGELEFPETLAGDGTRVAVGAVVRAVGDGEEDLDEGVDEV